MWSGDFDFDSVAPRKRRKIASQTKIKPKSSFHILTPDKIEDLVTHKKKIEEVRGWLEWATKSAQILLITGPAGCAKTITLQLVAVDLGIEVHEWVTPVDKLEYQLSNWLEPDPYDPVAYSEPKQVDKFEAFVFRSSRYQTLFSSKSRRILLVEDFPNHFLRQPQLFHDFLANYKTLGRCPIVFICIEDEKLNIAAQLFPNHIQLAFQVANIKFNPVSHTGLMKILQRNAAGLSVPKELLENIAKTCNGDIRAALSALQFSLISKSNSGTPQLGAVGKDTYTDFYKTLGRVLYPKRLEAPTNTGKVFLYDVKEIADNYDSTILNMLQENFLDTFSSLKEVTEACAILSDCDLLNSGFEEVREYAKLTCIIGLMTSNKNPKKGTFKPMNRSRWSRLLKQRKEENSRPYPHLNFTRRVLNLDVIPFLKQMPGQCLKLASSDLDRFTNGSVSKNNSSGSIFKAPQPPQVADEVDDLEDDMTIEEFED